MKDVNKIIILIFFFSFFTFSCKSLKDKNEKEYDGFVIKPELEKYKQYIDDARFKIYLKNGARKVAIKNLKLNVEDSMFLGTMNLSLANCEKKYNGLMVSFIFKYNDSCMYFDNSPSFTSSIFYRNKDMNDWFFAYGDLSILYFDLPNQIDTQQIVKCMEKKNTWNPWFEKRVRDSILQ